MRSRKARSQQAGVQGPPTGAALAGVRERVAPHVEAGRGRVAPAVEAARERLVPAVEAARERVAPAVEAARERVAPAVGAARERARGQVVDDLLPAVAGLTATAAATATAARQSAAERAQDLAIAAVGNLPRTRRRRRRRRAALLTLLVVAVSGALAAAKIRRDADRDWTSAGPGLPFTEPTGGLATAAPVTSLGTTPSPSDPGDLGDEALSDPEALQARAEAEAGTQATLPPAVGVPGRGEQQH